MLPVRHARRDVVAERGQADVAQKLARRPVQPRDPLGRLPEPEAVRFGRLYRERDVALRGETREDASDLK